MRERRSHGNLSWVAAGAASVGSTRSSSLRARCLPFSSARRRCDAKTSSWSPSLQSSTSESEGRAWQ